MTNFSRAYAVKFLYRIGGNGLHVSLFNALPGFIAVFATIPGIIWINKTRNKKAIMVNFFAISRLFTLSFVIIPFLPIKFQPLMFVVLTALMNFPESISVTGLQSFAGDIFLPSERSNAISLRNKFSTLAQLIAFLILGQALTSSSISEAIIIKKYQIFFVLAFIIGIFEILSFYKLKEKSCTYENTSVNLMCSLNRALHNKKFMIFMLCSLLFHFGWQMGWPLFSIYQIDFLGADEGWLTILNITSSLIMFLSFNFWSRMIIKKGNTLIITITTFCMSLTPVLFVLSPNLYIMTLTGSVTGFFTAGTVVVILNSLLEVVPEDERIIYVGIHSTFTNITLAIAPMIGNYIHINNTIQIALLFSALFRFIGSIAFWLRSKSKNS
jgi:hypothetical protein